MSAANFQTMENFPLFILDTDDDCDFILYDMVEQIQQAMEEQNRGLLFHSVSIVSGYYCGLQLFVDEEHDPNVYDNRECDYYFSMYRSVAIRRYNSEANKVKRLLEKIAKEYGFNQYYVAEDFPTVKQLTPVYKTQTVADYSKPSIVKNKNIIQIG